MFVKHLDSRLNASQPVPAATRLMQVKSAIVGVHRAPRSDAMQLTQALMGEHVQVYDMRDGWAWGQLERDRYVGFLPEASLNADIVASTHRVAVPSTFIYPEPNLKSGPAAVVTMNAQVAVIGGDEHFSGLANGGFVFTAHLKPVREFDTDFTAVAGMFLNAPYYWGGKSIHGLDCSGLVQLSLEACGIACLRDSDMQEQDLGKPVLVNDLDALQRGDLVFWKGHVGIMRDEHTLLHANGHHMLTVAEPLREAAARIARSTGEITAIKRL